MEKRYYYKAKNGNGYLNLKTPLADDSKYDVITKEEWDAAQATKFEPTPEQVAKREREQRILNLKGYLRSTDWVVVKIAEETDPEEIAALREKYANVIAERKAKRAEINELEGE